MKGIILGIVSSLFFAVTFVLNHSMELDGGSWLWSASLRYFFMLPFLYIIVYLRGKDKLTQLHLEMKSNWQQWLLWSFVGFGLFYAPLTFAAQYSPGWLVSGTWQFTIIAGLLLAPLFTIFVEGKKIRAKIPLISLFISCFILVGILFIQVEQAKSVTLMHLFLGIIPILIASFAYPLGNRKMMTITSGKIDSFQRVLGMTLFSMPLWIALAFIAVFTVGAPSLNQVVQSLIVAVSSGVIATTLFFIATDLARTHQGRLAAVEATQSTEVLFAIILEVLLLNIAFPSTFALVGVSIIIVGMIMHCYVTAIVSKKTNFVNKKA